MPAGHRASLSVFIAALGSDDSVFITTRIGGEAQLVGLRDGTVKARWPWRPWTKDEGASHKAADDAEERKPAGATA